MPADMVGGNLLFGVFGFGSYASFRWKRESKAPSLLVNVARSDPSTWGYNTAQAYRNVILQEHGRVLLFLSDNLEDE
ncbi:MAG TPA: hypothetical protein VGZ25_15905 [Gemmataceae bacterium]|jgi:hypothetical protein|nr:hypothetical protein [Gemmataceae bacterium]